MSDNHIQVEGHPDLVRDSQSHAIINRNRSAYEQAKKELKMHKKQEMILEMQRER